MDGIVESSILQKMLNMTSQRLIEKQMILDQNMKILEENEGQTTIREKGNTIKDFNFDKNAKGT